MSQLFRKSQISVGTVINPVALARLIWEANLQSAYQVNPLRACAHCGPRAEVEDEHFSHFWPLLMTWPVGRPRRSNSMLLCQASKNIFCIVMKYYPRDPYPPNCFHVTDKRE